ncbi:hypothetical protein [Enterococcus hirae]|uniref:hypothetical protein n=1 Tax=Enterococcus hirae TaxID=1354 RepID=UPI0006B21761|nr:hypothetical protein [Enterococcus hirae]MBE8786944.1 hypothetical protein [Enterococcus hirae]MBE8805449.1 hypothetical protein [Enterococcus hirae]MCC4035304.1 hypothetical protein [Enterococcus hirae]NBA40035.1 hypothetical protein [Enterococcus hirae]NBA56088.1 hypothetical protein [Enterococcus hirae]
MLSLNNKTCTKVSRNFLIGSFFLMMLMIVGLFGKVYGFIPLSDLPEGSLMIFYYLSCLLSGLSLIFSTGAHSKILKRTAAIVHFSSVYWFSLFIFGFLFVEVFHVLFFIVLYLFLAIVLLTASKQKWLAITFFGIPMIISIGFFIKLNYKLILYGGEWSWDTIVYIVILHLSGLSGLILSTQLDKGKAKWILLSINYLFATYYHIYIFLH